MPVDGQGVKIAHYKRSKFNSLSNKDSATIYYVEETDGKIKQYIGNTLVVSDSVPWTGVSGKPTFATVATSGSYNDLSNKPSDVSYVLTKDKIDTALKGTGSAPASSIQLGGAASAAGGYSTALGTGASATASSTAIGHASATVGNYSTALGTVSKALGNNSTAIGGGASASGTASTALGYDAVAGTSTRLMRLGAPNLSILQSTVNLTVTSDIRDKADIEEVPKALDFIKDLNPITYVGNNRDSYISEEQKETDTYRNYLMVEDYDKVSHNQGTKKGSRRRVGLSAQEVREKLIEHYGSDNYANVVNDNFVEFEERGLDIPEGLENKLTMSYETMVPFLIKAIQEQQEQIEELKQKINSNLS